MQIQGVDLEVWVAVLAALGALTVWGLKRYRTVMADGKVTLDEIINTIEGSEEHIDALGEKMDRLDTALKTRKCSVCSETGHDKRNCPNKTEDE